MDVVCAAMAAVSRSRVTWQALCPRHTVRGRELGMAWVKRWFAVMACGGTLLGGLTGCVVAPVEPGYVASPPVVVIRPYRHDHYRPHRYDHPYRYYRPDRPYDGYPYGHRW
jgi:hypothetical protein